MQPVDERDQHVLLTIAEWNNVFPVSLDKLHAQLLELQGQPYQLHAASAAAVPVSTSDAEPVLPPSAAAPSQAPKRTKRSSAHKVTITANSRTTGRHTTSTATSAIRCSR